MKKTYLLALLITLTFINKNLKAAEGVFSFDGIVITDLNGTTWDLGALQSQGKTIVLDFWATWCGPCLSSIPSKTQLWNNYGPTATGDSSIYIFSIENDASTQNEQTIITQRNIVNPVIRRETITGFDANTFAYGGSIPYYVVVCPNGYWQDRTGGLTSTQPILSLAEKCTNLKPIDFFVKKLTSNFTYCPSQLNNTWSLDNVRIANLGSSVLDSMTILVKLDGVVVEIIKNNTPVNPGEEKQLVVSPFNFYAMNHQTVDVEVYSANGVIIQNDDVLVRERSFLRGTYVTSESTIKLNIKTDSWPEETGYQLRTSNNTVVTSGAAGIFSNEPNTIVSRNLTLSTLNDCHIIRLTDSYGDGIVEGNFQLEQNNGTIILFNNEEFQNTVNDRFLYAADSDGDGFNDIVESLAGTDPNNANDFPLADLQEVNDSDGDGFSDELEIAEGSDPNNANSTPLNKENDPTSLNTQSNSNIFKVYPSPANSYITVELSNSKVVQVEIVNILGMKVYSEKLINSSVTIDVSNFINGIYMVSIKENGMLTNTKKIVVSK